MNFFKTSAKNTEEIEKRSINNRRLDTAVFETTFKPCFDDNHTDNLGS